MISGYRGLARAIIERFYESDAKLSVLVRNSNAAEELRAQFPDALFVEGDIANAASAAVWTEKTVAKFGTIDALVNNAAILGPTGKWGELDFAEVEKTIAVNLLAPMRLIQTILPHFLKHAPVNGVVINLSGGGATGPRPHFSSYSVSKIGVVRLTENLSLEYPALRFYAVAPGILKTQMVEKVLDGDPTILGKEFEDAQRCIESGGNDPNRAVSLIEWLVRERPAHLSGALISAVHDKYTQLPATEVSPGWWRLRRVDEVLCRDLNRNS